MTTCIPRDQIWDISAEMIQMVLKNLPSDLTRNKENIFFLGSKENKIYISYFYTTGIMFTSLRKIKKNES